MAALFPIRCLGDKSATLGTRRQKVDLVQPAENGTKPAASDVTSLKIEAPAIGMIGFKMIVYVYISGLLCGCIKNISKERRVQIVYLIPLNLSWQNRRSSCSKRIIIF